MDSGVTRIPPEDKSRIPRWLRAILEVPLEMKLLGANLIIVGIAVLLLFGPFQLQPTRLTDAFIVVAALTLGATVNSSLVWLALGPLKSIERVATWVSQGRNDKRVPSSMVADRELRRLSRILNDMLDNLMADRVRMETLSAEVAYAERSQLVQELHDLIGRKLADATLQIAAVANEVESRAHSTRLVEISELLRSAIRDIRIISRSSLLQLVTDTETPREREALDAVTRQGLLANVRMAGGVTHAPPMRRQADTDVIEAMHG